MRISDAHNDIFTSKKSVDEIKEYLINIGQKSAVSVLTGVLWTLDIECGGADVLRLLEPFKGFKTASEIVFAVENLNFMANEDAKILSDYQIKYASLTWNFDNKFGGGALGQGGITELGKSMIRSLKEQKIALDTAHLNRRTFHDIIDLEHHKILCSHANMDAICPHPRNLTDHQIQLILQKNGFVGICFVTPFLTKNAVSTIADIARHIDYFVQRFGCKGLGIGTDFFGTTEHTIGMADYNGFYELREKLASIGYKNSDIEDIFYLNYKNFLFS